MSIQILMDEVESHSNVQLVSILNRTELVDARSHLQSKRAGLVDGLNKSIGGAAKREFEKEISNVNKLSKKVNQAISLMDQATHQAKFIAKQSKNPHFAKKFIKIAEAELDAQTFKRIKEQALKVA